MAEVFQLRPYFEWRGMGFISQSALSIRDDYAEWDAERRFSVPGVRVTDPKAAQCGEVLEGSPQAASMQTFWTECTPEHPIGALMVSSEGSCAAYYNYEHRKTAESARPRSLDRRVVGSAVLQVAFASRRSRWPMAPAAKPAAVWSKGYLRRSLFGASTEPLGDAAHLEVNGAQIAITTDSFVVKPLRFPGRIDR